MSNLEGANKPHMRRMMNDEAVELNPQQKKLLTRWAILKSMVIESIHRRNALFYSKDEREGMNRMPSPSLPLGTFVWIGRLSFKAFHANATDVWGNIDQIPKAVHSCVTTIVVGHLVFQVVTGHAIPKYATYKVISNCKPGAWDKTLLEIWPCYGSTSWPPTISFGRNGPNHIAALLDRWRIGTRVSG